MHKSACHEVQSHFVLFQHEHVGWLLVVKSVLCDSQQMSRHYVEKNSFITVFKLMNKRADLWQMLLHVNVFSRSSKLLVLSLLFCLSSSMFYVYPRSTSYFFKLRNVMPLEWFRHIIDGYFFLAFCSPFVSLHFFSILSRYFSNVWLISLTNSADRFWILNVFLYVCLLTGLWIKTTVSRKKKNPFCSDI